MAPKGELDGRIIVVTGASRGIGYQVAKAAARQGAQIIAVARTVGGLEELDDEITSAGGKPATLVPLDLTDGDGIDRLGAAIHQRWSKLDGLAACAGIMPGLSPVGHFQVKDWDQSIGTNLTANWRLLRSFDPLFRGSDAARIVALTAPYARTSTPYFSAYAVAKSGLESLVRTYAAEVDHLGTIKANLLEPHPVQSALRARIMPGENATILPKPESVADEIVARLLPSFVENGELSVLELAGD